MHTKTKFRLLVVRLGSMGDILHALPAVTALRARHPDWEIGWVVEPRWAPLLEANPFVDCVVVFRRERFFESLRELRSQILALADRPEALLAFLTANGYPLSAIEQVLVGERDSEGVYEESAQGM